MRTLLQLTMFLVFVMHQVASDQNDCGNTSFSGSDGVVTSPNFPLPYPHNLSCTYSIDVGRNNSILLNFLDFDLELPLSADNCTRDWLMITCNETDDENLDFRKRYCGAELPRTSLRFFNCPVVQLKFFADSSVNGGGFAIQYTVLENSTSADSITDLDCGDTLFTSSSGFIRLPSNPTEYSATVNCTYTISTDNTSTFSLGVLSLQQPQLLDSIADCDRDYIMVGCVSDGETELNPNTSNTYCRRSFDDASFQPSRIVFSNCRIVKIFIRSSDYNLREDNGFPFAVRVNDEDCGSTFFTGPTGNVTSPQFPLSHPHSLDCVYFVDVDRTKTVTIYFLAFNLDGTSRSPYTDVCSNSSLTVSCLLDSGSVLANPNQNSRYCGEKLKPMLLNYSNCDSLAVNFFSNSSVNKGEFQLRYTITSPGNTTPYNPDVPVKVRGNTSLTGSTGFITSPQFPLSYPHNLDHVYSIDGVIPTKIVGLYFYSFNIEGTSHGSYYMDDCHYDWLLISSSPGRYHYTSLYYSYRGNRKFCGEKTSQILKFYHCDSLTLNFVTDSSLTSGGFKIWYTITSPGQSDCGNTSYSGPNGFVTSPNFPLAYPSNLGCTYSIDVGRNSFVELKFKHFELEAPNSAGYCANDWLKITCNETTKTNPYNNRKYCGAIKWTSALRFVDCSSLTLEFFSGSTYSRGAGFMIEYTVAENSNSTDDNVELDCGATLFTNSSGNISLPLNPTNYLATVNCTYTISTNRTSVIWLNTYLTQTAQLLQSFQDCDRENLMVGCISEGETEMNPNTARVFCHRGSSWSPLVFVDCRTLKLSIRSNTYDYRDTSRIPFLAVEPNEICGNTSFSAPTGIVSTLRLPFHYQKSVNCLYTIDNDDVESFALSIDYLFVGHWYWEGSCANGWLTITCLVNGTSVAHPLANRKLCALGYPTRTRFPACHRVIFNFSSNEISSERGFTIRYRIGDHELDCGATLFTNSSGDIILPRNPTSNLATVNCTYTISANNLSYIWLNTYFYSWMQLFQSFQDCGRESVTVGCVSEGGTELNPSTTKVFCRQERQSYDHTPLAFYDCGTLKLSIRSSTYDYGETFRIPFLVVEPDEICGNTSFSTPTGIVSSLQGVPFRFSKRLNCLYTIDIGNVNSVVLSLDRLLYSDQYCTSGWLTITCLVNGTSTAHPFANKKHCAVGYPSRARFPACDRVFFNFSTNDISSGKGFTIRYSIGDYELDCGTTLFTNSSGDIILPRNPTNYLATVNCTYTISANNLSYIWLNTYNWYTWTQLLQSFQDCGRESLTIGCLSEGETELNPSTTKVFCRQERSSYSHIPLAFADCRSLKLSIISSYYDFPGTFRVPFSVIGPEVICGNTSFSTPTGIVSTPRLPFRLSKRISCLYTIDIGHVNSVVLSLDRLNVGNEYYRPHYSDQPCTSGWLTITCLVNGTSMAHPIANKKRCGNQYGSVPARFPACHRVFFNFSSDDISPDKGFTIRYRIGDHELDCGATLFTNSSGDIILPRNPTNFLATVNCTYTISANNLSYIWLNTNTYYYTWMQFFQSFQDCDRENLTVGCLSEGGTELNPSTTKVFCRQERSSYGHIPLVFADCGTLKLSIRSNTYDYRETFRIPFSVYGPDAICGNTSFSTPTGIVSTPLLPFRISKRVNCLYTIDTGHVNSVVLSLDRLNFGNDYYYRDHGSCSSGSLTITCLVNGTSMTHPIANKKLCGNQYSTTARFPACDSVFFNFSSDDISPDKGFTIRYTIGDYELDCGTTLFTNSSGFINLPRNPTNYLATVNCTYTISANNLSYIWLNTYLFTSMPLFQSFQDCDRESLTIGCVSEGETELNPNPTKVLCRRESSSFHFSFHQLVFYDCPTLKLSIRSNTYDFRETFRIPFTVYEPNSICGNTSFSAPTGIVSTLQLPFHYPKSVNCLYTIDGGHVNSVALSVDRLNLGSVHTVNGPCYGGWLTISCLANGTSMAHPLADRQLCGNINPIVARFPACRSVLLNFSSDSVSSGTGFFIRYRIGDYDPECGNTSFSGPDGFIASPLFPLSYPHNLNCLYSITGGQRNKISLSFLSFRLDGSSNPHYYMDHCYSDWLTVSCLSDESVVGNLSSSRRYCGIKTTPLAFAFSYCAAVVLNFRSDSYTSLGGFKVHYKVRDLDTVCGVTAFGRPSGVISFPWDYTYYDGALDCIYVIKATEPSSISLTIWSISLQSSVRDYCQRDWLLITCIDGQRALSLNVTHITCDYLNSSIQITFPGCAATQVVFHRDVEDTGKTFRIEYTITSNAGDNVPITELQTTSISTTKPVGTDKSCATGCKLSSDSTKCDCLPGTSQTATIPVSTDIPVTLSATCEVGCTLSADGTTCDCSTTHSGDLVNTQTNLSGQRGHAVGVSLTVILVVIGAICLGAFLLFRRHRKKNRSEMLLEASEEERAQMELEADSTKSGSIFERKQDRETSSYLPLKPMPFSDHDEI